MKPEKTTKRGHCRDCAQGFISPVHTGFSLFIDLDGNESFWYCLYCGSNHVDILDEDGKVIYHGEDLY